MFHKKLFIGALLFAGGQLLQAAEPEPEPEPDPVLVATPRARVQPITATSRPFLAAARSQQPVDLAARGYVESEVAVRGHINAAQPWATRILVRRPLDARKFSGRVIVEPLNALAQHESAPLWGFSWEYFLRRGDAWVGVTISPAAVNALGKFNAARYASLTLVSGEAGCGNVAQEGAAGDVMAQVGALLRSSSKENPLLGLNPQRLIAAGYSGGGDYITSFAATVHRALRLGDGAPVFDGYLNVSGLAASLEPCAMALPRGVPFVSVLTGRDAEPAPAMRGSVDAQGEYFRVHEVAGVSGARPLPAGVPVAADLATAGITAPADVSCREPIMDQALAFAINAIWQQLDDLLVLKQPMTVLPRIETDVAGNAPGGWRLPQVDLPLAGVVPGAPRVCSAATGSMPRFDAATLKRLYRDRNEYLRRFNAAVDQAVADRLLVKEDAAALKAAAVRTTPAF